MLLSRICFSEIYVQKCILMEQTKPSPYKMPYLHIMVIELTAKAAKLLPIPYFQMLATLTNFCGLVEISPPWIFGFSAKFPIKLKSLKLCKTCWFSHIKIVREACLRICQPYILGGRDFSLGIDYPSQLSCHFREMPIDLVNGTRMKREFIRSLVECESALNTFCPCKVSVCLMVFPELRATAISSRAEQELTKKNSCRSGVGKLSLACSWGSHCQTPRV